jgi:putative FmdB family regulatory protein
VPTKSPAPLATSADEACNIETLIFLREWKSLMPLYEYECPDCGRFEVIQKFSAKPLKHCPTCKEQGRTNSVTKAVSASAFHLKGSGWYKTDYSSGSSSSGSSSKPKAKSSESSSTSSDSGASDTTPKKAACGSGCGCH